MSLYGNFYSAPSMPNNFGYNPYMNNAMAYAYSRQSSRTFTKGPKLLTSDTGLGKIANFSSNKNFNKTPIVKHEVKPETQVTSETTQVQNVTNNSANQQDINFNGGMDIITEPKKRSTFLGKLVLGTVGFGAARGLRKTLQAKKAVEEASKEGNQEIKFKFGKQLLEDLKFWKWSDSSELKKGFQDSEVWTQLNHSRAFKNIATNEIVYIQNNKISTLIKANMGNAKKLLKAIV